MELLKQIGRFLVVGGLAFGVDYGTMWLLAEGLGVNYLVASAAGFLVSVIFNYILSSLWVFNAENSTSAGGFIIFGALSGIGLLINLAVMWLWVDVFLGNYLVAKVFATGVVMVYNFISRKMVLDRKGHPSGQGSK